MTTDPAGPNARPAGCTPSQTVGPFFHMALPWADGPFVVPAATPNGFWLRGQVFDGAGDPVSDAIVETWQCDPGGRFAHPDDVRGDAAPTVAGFRGFGRCPTDADGRFAIFTVRPGCLPAEGGQVEAPHINVSVFARGLLHRVVTRVYFADEPAANAVDPVLASIDDAGRRATLVAVVADDSSACFDIRLQGPRETVFFDV